MMRSQPKLKAMMKSQEINDSFTLGQAFYK